MSAVAVAHEPAGGPAGVGLSVPRATYKIEVAWTTQVTGAFQLDRSQIGGTDTLALNSWTQTFSGPYDDVTADVYEFEITRGRSDDLSTVDAGKATITLRDAAGKYSPTNPAGPLYGQLLPMRPVRITATYAGVSWPLYYGFLQTIDAQPGQRLGETKLECADLFCWLDVPPDRDDIGVTLPVIARMTGTTTGAAIGAILDSIQWNDASLRSIDTGDDIPWFEALGDKTPLTHIAELLEANRGIFYIDGAGKAVYEHRNTRAARSPYAAVANTMSLIAPGVSLDKLVNEWIVTREYETVPGTLVNSTPQTAQDAASVRSYGLRQQALTSKYLISDTYAAGLASFLVSRTKDPVSPIWSMTIDNRTDTLFQALLGAELQRKLTVSETKFGTSGDYYIEQITHHVDRTKRHTTSFVMTPVQPGESLWLRLGVGQLDVNTLGF